MLRLHGWLRWLLVGLFAVLTPGCTEEATGFIVFVIAIYFLPAVIATSRRHNSAGAITALNILAGWTFVGWVGSFVWSLTGDTKKKASPRTAGVPQPEPAPPVPTNDHPSDEVVWYVGVDGKQSGPFSADELHDFSDDVLVWRRGMQEWRAKSEIFEQEESPPDLPPELPDQLPKDEPTHPENENGETSDEASWIVAIDGQQSGPFTSERLREIPGEALVWREGMEDWQPKSEVFEQEEEEGNTTPPSSEVSEQAPASKKTANRALRVLAMIGCFVGGLAFASALGSLLGFVPGGGLVLLSLLFLSGVAGLIGYYFDAAPPWLKNCSAIIMKRPLVSISVIAFLAVVSVVATVAGLARTDPERAADEPEELQAAEPQARAVPEDEEEVDSVEAEAPSEEPSEEVTVREEEPDSPVSEEDLEEIRGRIDGKLLSDGVLLEIGINQVETGNPVVYGSTNLPDETDLMVMIRGEGLGFKGDSKVKVEDGVFVSGAFGPEGGLATGRYTAEVMMPLPAVQSDSVKDVIGAKGENLKGKFVEKASIGKTVKNKIEFFIGEDPESAVAEEQERREEMKREAREILKALRRLRKEGKRMARVRRRSEAGDLSATAKCGDLMRRYQGEAKKLRKRADRYDNLLFRGLSSACGSIQACVSCSLSYAEGDLCTMVDETLRDATKRIRKL